MSLSKRDNDDLRNLHNASSGPSKSLSRASDSGQGSAKWTQPPTLIPIPGNQSRQPPKQSATRSSGWNPYTAARLKSTMDQGKKGGAPSLNLTSGATVLGKNGPTPSKRRRIDLNSPRPASSSKYFLGQQPSSSRSRPAIGHGAGNAMEIMDVDGEDLGVVTSRLGHHSDQSSEDELLLKGRSSEDNGNGSRALPRASTSKLPSDGAYTQRLQQKVGGLGHSREQAIPITDNSIDEITEFSDDNGYGIAKGIVERGKAIFDQPKILSQSTLTKKIDFNALSRTIGGVKARMKGKNQPTQQFTPVAKTTSSITKGDPAMGSAFPNTKPKQVTNDLTLPLETWTRGLSLASTEEEWSLVVNGDTSLQVKAKSTGGVSQDIRLLEMQRVVRSIPRSLDSGLVIMKIWPCSSNRSKRKIKEFEEDTNIFQAGAKAENGCIALKFRIDPDDEEICERYAALFRLVGNFGKKIEDVDSSGSKSAWELTTNAIALFLNNRGQTESVASPSSAHANGPARRRLPARQAAASGRLTRARQREIEEPEPEDRRSPDADKLILVYPFSGTGAVNITKGDLRRLRPGEYLNDTLIEFGLKLWLEGIRAHNAELADQIHVFSSFFYKKLNVPGKDKTPGYQSVRKWTAKIDLFSKKYIIVPINEHVHWYLAIICNPEYVLLEPPPQETVPHTGPITRKRKRIEDSPEPELPSPPPPPPSKPNADGAQSVSRPTSPKGEIVPDSEDEREDVATQSTKKADDDGDTIEVEHLLKRSCSLNDNDELSSNQEMGRSSPLSSIPPDADQLAYPSETDEMAVDVSSTATPAVESNDSISTLSRAMPVNEPLSPEVPYGGSVSSALDQLPPVPPTRFYHSSASRKMEKTPVTLGDINLADAEPEGEPPGDEEVVTKSGEPEPNKTYIFTFDSLGSDHKPATKTLGRYLQFEARDKKGKELEQTSVAIGRPAFVPYQPNYCDCGVYVFHFVERFMSDPEKYTRLILSKVKKSDYPSAERDRDWGHEVVPSMRASLTSRVEELSQQWQKYTEEKEAQKKAEAAAAGISAEVTAIDDSDSDVEVIVTSDPKKPVRKAMRLR